MAKITRKTYTKKKSYKKKSPNRWTTYGNAGSQLWKDVMLLKQLINTEFKYDYTSASIAQVLPPSAGGNFYLLNGIALGTTAQTRNGQSVLIKSLQIKYNVEMITAVEDTKVRVMVVIDKQPNATAPTLDNILNNVSTTEVALVTTRELTYRKRFIILYDRFHKMNEGVQRVAYGKYYKQLSMHTTYNATGGSAITDINTNSLYLVAFSNKANPDYPLLTFESCTRYLDN